MCVRAIFELKFAHTNTHTLTSRVAPSCKLHPEVRTFATDLILSGTSCAPPTLAKVSNEAN